MSGSSVISGVTSKSSPDTSLTSGLGTTSEASHSTTPARPPKTRRPSMLTRPTVAPPEPPARKPITFMLGPSSARDYSEPSPAASGSAVSASSHSELKFQKKSIFKCIKSTFLTFFQKYKNTFYATYFKNGKKSILAPKKKSLKL